jgi:pyruvate/2-oxoglutarate dehydrogenase complex dihydrolipoamide acyltransferase (E2) component
MLAAMPTTDETTPGLPTDEPAGAPGEAATAPTADTVGGLEESAVVTDAGDGLSPAVRRLVRQYDLDITGIHGTGPDGRIRVGDVIGILGPRAEQAVRGVTTPRPAPVEAENDAANADESSTEPPAVAPAPAAAPAAAITTVYECDLGRVIAHRKRLRAENVELLLTSYFVAAFVEALGAVPELALAAAPRIGVRLTTTDGDTPSLKLDASAAAAEPFTERARTVDAILRRSVGAGLSDTHLLVHHYGASGSLIATPTPLGAGHVASLGIGRVRREIVLRNLDGDETPRVTTRCHLSLSFLPEHVTLARANQFLAHSVRLLEQWPE